MVPCFSTLHMSTCLAIGGVSTSMECFLSPRCLDDLSLLIYEGKDVENVNLHLRSARCSLVVILYF